MRRPQIGTGKRDFSEDPAAWKIKASPPKWRFLVIDVHGITFCKIGILISYLSEQICTYYTF